MMLIGTSKPKNKEKEQEKKKKEDRNRYPRTMSGVSAKDVPYDNTNTRRGRKRKGMKEKFWSNNDWEFQKSMASMKR